MYTKMYKILYISCCPFVRGSDTIMYITSQAGLILILLTLSEQFTLNTVIGQI